VYCDIEVFYEWDVGDKGDGRIVVCMNVGMYGCMVSM